MNMTDTLVNGIKTTNVSCFNRGLQFGDGLFETIAIFKGDILQWPFHWQRFVEGCARLSLPVPSEQLIFDEIKSVIGKQDKEVAKFTYTRGESKRGYAFNEIPATRIITRSDWPLFNEVNQTKGISLYSCCTRLAHQPLLAGIKHLNRLENVMARHEWQNTQFSEGLLQDVNGLLIEGTMSNLFVIKDQEVFTPNLINCGVAGVTRRRIIESAGDYSVTVCDVKESLLAEADEAFMCNSLIGIWPINQVGKHFFSTEQSGNPVTRYYQKRLNTGYELVI